MSLSTYIHTAVPFEAAACINLVKKSNILEIDQTNGRQPITADVCKKGCNLPVCIKLTYSIT